MLNSTEFEKLVSELKEDDIGKYDGCLGFAVVSFYCKDLFGKSISDFDFNRLQDIIFDYQQKKQFNV